MEKANLLHDSMGPHRSKHFNDNIHTWAVTEPTVISYVVCIRETEKSLQIYQNLWTVWSGPSSTLMYWMNDKYDSREIPLNDGSHSGWKCYWLAHLISVEDIVEIPILFRTGGHLWAAGGHLLACLPVCRMRFRELKSLTAHLVAQLRRFPCLFFKDFGSHLM